MELIGDILEEAGVLFLVLDNSSFIPQQTDPGLSYTTNPFKPCVIPGICV